MEIPESIRPPRVVRVIPPTINTQESIREKYKQLRVVAYCRVSTKQEEQLNSYETQKNYYTEKINAEPNWTLAGIFADKGIIPICEKYSRLSCVYPKAQRDGSGRVF